MVLSLVHVIIDVLSYPGHYEQTPEYVGGQCWDGDAFRKIHVQARRQKGGYPGHHKYRTEVSHVPLS